MVVKAVVLLRVAAMATMRRADERKLRENMVVVVSALDLLSCLVLLWL